MKGFASFGTRRRRVAGLSLLMSTMIVTSVTVANAQTLTWLGTLGGGYSVARDVSADGRVVVGWAENASGQRRAFRWTQAGGMKDLGTLGDIDTLGGNYSIAFGVSADGNVVVGYSYNSCQLRAFRWTQAGVMRDLNSIYASLLKDGSYLEAAYAISPNGRYIVGVGYNAATERGEAFLLDTGKVPSR